MEVKVLITKTHFIRALCFLPCKKEKIQKSTLKCKYQHATEKQKTVPFIAFVLVINIFTQMSLGTISYTNINENRSILVVDSFSVSKFNFTISRYTSFHFILGYAHFHSLLQANLVSVKYTSFLISFMRQQYKNGLKAEFANNTVIV